MRIKDADDKQPQLDALAALLARSDVDVDTRRRIEGEIKTMRAGIAGEREAAYEIDFQYGPRPGWAIIHDLRFEVGERVAQVDHLLINRLLDVWVLESKHFAEGVSVDEHGEWLSWFGRRPYGIPSPIEQNRRHMAVLRDVFDKGLVRLPKRLGAVTIKPRISSLVLVSNNARISRPKSKAAAAAVDGLSTVIKAERLRPTIEKDFDARSVAIVGKLVGEAEVDRVARELTALHRPSNVDWGARFGLPAAGPVGAAVQANPPASANPTPGTVTSTGTTCRQCGRAVSAAVVDYCAANVDKLGGWLLCYDCQRTYRRAARA